MRLLVLILLLAGLGGYSLHSWSEKSKARQLRYDVLIAPVAAKYNLDPLLVRALIWRESRFVPTARGLNKERGLMQVTPGVADEWAGMTHSQPVEPDALFDPATNIEIGSWYLAHTLRHWQETDKPAAFALAEYNAGRTNSLRWVDPADPVSSSAFERRITYPSTRRYVDAILQKYDDYQRGTFRPPWLGWTDRLTKGGDQPTVEKPTESPIP